MREKEGRRPRGRLAVLAVAALLVAAPLAAQAPTAPGDSLTLADVVARALKNNPDTRAAYARAQAASALYAVERGSLLPTLSLSAPVSRSKSVSGGNSFSGGRTQFTPGVSLSYLLFDFGGRSGSIAQAHQTAIAASAQNDATVDAVVLQAEAAFFAFNAARDVLGAQQSNVRMASEARDAAVQRLRVGLATVADTLQASTALAQAQLAVLTDRAQVQTARGDLAAAMGTSAAEPFRVASPAPTAEVLGVTESVDSLMARAIRARPELAAAQAQASAAEAQVRATRALGLPSLTLGGNAGRSMSDVSQLNGNSYGLTLGVQIPVFAGGARVNGVRAAKELAEAARASADATRVQVANQVYTSYTTLGIAGARVKASAQLLASAEESEAVARGRYREGVGSIIDLLTAQSALAAARAESAQARWAWQTALAQLAHDVGTLDATGAPGLPLTTNESVTAPR